MSKLLLKWVINAAIVVPAMMYYSIASFWGATIAATALTVIAYLLGDQLLLRSTNNAAATFADIVLAAAYLSVLSYVFNWKLSIGEAIFIAFLIGAAEWVLHRYVMNEELKVIS